MALYSRENLQGRGVPIYLQRRLAAPGPSSKIKREQNGFGFWEPVLVFAAAETTETNGCRANQHRGPRPAREKRGSDCRRRLGRRFLRRGSSGARRQARARIGIEAQR